MSDTSSPRCTWESAVITFLCVYVCAFYSSIVYWSNRYLLCMLCAFCQLFNKRVLLKIFLNFYSCACYSEYVTCT